MGIQSNQSQVFEINNRKFTLVLLSSYLIQNCLFNKQGVS